MKEAFLRRMREANARDLEEARAASNAKTLSQRAEEAFEWYLLNLADMADRARDEAELEAMLARGHEHVSLRRIWEQRRKPGS